MRTKARLVGYGLRANLMHILLQDGVATAITEVFDSLKDQRGGHTRIFLQAFCDYRFKWVKLALSLARSRCLRRGIQILLDRLPAHVEMALKLSNGPFLGFLGHVQPVQLIDLIARQHRWIPLSGNSRKHASRLLFARCPAGTPPAWKCFYHPDLPGN